MKKLLLLIMFASMAVLSPAPFIDKGPISGPQRESTQEELSRQQELMRTQSEVGQVPSGTNPVQNNPETSGDAMSILQSAEESKAKHDPDASEVLKTANANIEKSQGKPARTFIWALIFGAFGFGAVFAFRKWASNNIPDMPETKKITW